ncbi:hypothetical protein ACIBG8_23785 [Nonomuraea sp. NPDC050556]|uniref:hypothetical protein n=1 Tax=Nonomuraea sp. NPDC050556 TaxID=3364369 RepID=UPI0037B310BB
MSEPLLLTHEGLQLLLESESDPFRRRDLAPEQAEQYDRLQKAGLLDERGRVTPESAPALAAIRQPVVRLEIEMAVGRTGRRWYAAMGETRSVILAPPSLALGPDVSAAQVASFAEPPSEFELLVVERAWTPVEACSWLGVGPREQRADLIELPADALQRRLADPAEPVPPGVDPEVWSQPLLMWGLTADPGGHSMLVLDAGASGLWAFAGRDPRARLVPLPSYEAWRLVLQAITEAFTTAQTS